MPDPTPSPTPTPTPTPDDREYPPGPDHPCENDQRSEPIRYATGQISLAETELSWSGFGFSWSHRRSYANILEGVSTPGVHGHHWFLNDQPFLVFGTDPITTLATVTVVAGTLNLTYFIDDEAGGWAPRFGSRESLVHDTTTHTYVVTATNGRSTVFHDDSSSVAAVLRGKLKSIVSPGGGVAAADWSGSPPFDALHRSGGIGIGRVCLLLLPRRGGRSVSERGVVYGTSPSR